MWRDFSGNPISSLEEFVRQHVLRFRQQGIETHVWIGSDSQVKGELTDFCTVVFLRHPKKGGRLFYFKERVYSALPMEQRLIKETDDSIAVARTLEHMLKMLDVPFEVHADINPDKNFPSSQCYAYAKGYTQGMGYVFKSKPESYASTQAADYIVHRG